MTGHGAEEVASEPSQVTSSGAPAWDRLEDQLSWYDARSLKAQRAYKRVKIGQLVLGAGVPITALTSTSPVVTATIGALVVVLEGLQQLYQWQTNWVVYRSTAEALKHEKYLFLAHAGPYAGRDAQRVLAERIEGLVSQEHAKWTESRIGRDADATGLGGP
jgi:hypothetical protein